MNTVLVRITIREGAKVIFTIKTVRQATGLGLREAKDIVDQARGATGKGLSGTTVRLTLAQFGMLTALIELAEATQAWGFHVAVIKLEAAEVVDFDTKTSVPMTVRL